LKEILMSDEPFVSADVAAAATGINRRFLLTLARHGIAGAYPLGTGLRLRNTWVFLLSELKEAIKRNRENIDGARPFRRRYHPVRQSPLN
jgi:hypothetical protein